MLERWAKRPCLALWCAVGLATACRRDAGLPTEPRSIDDVFGQINTCWYGSQSSWSPAQPAVVGNIVVSPSGDQKLTARDRVTGTVLWSTVVTSVNGEQRIWGRNLVARSGVVVAAVSRNTVGVDVATGQELWSYGAPRDSLADPPGKPATVELVTLDADDSTVYIPAWGASVSAVNIHTGIARWVWKPEPGPFRSGAAAVRISGDTVFASVWHSLSTANTSSEVWVVSIDRTTGQELGRATIPPYTIGNPLNGSPVVWQHLVFVAGTGGRLWAVHRATQQIVWQYEPALDEGIGATAGGPALYGDVVYADGGNGYALAMAASSGAVLWRAKILGPVLKDIYVTPARVYVSIGGFLSILDRSDGRHVARTMQPQVPIDGTLFASPPTSSGGRVYVNTNRGVWCFNEP